MDPALLCASLPRDSVDIGDAPPASSSDDGMVEPEVLMLRARVRLYADGVRFAERTVPYLAKGGALPVNEFDS